MEDFLKFADTQIENTFKSADKIVERNNGDIYGAPLKEFQKWHYTIERASFASFILSKLPKEYQS